MNRVEEYYNSYNEDIRLRNRRSRILEKITTLKYVNKYLSTYSTVADIGAGTGVYSIEIANSVKSIYAVELVKKHGEEMDNKLKQHNIKNIQTYCGSALDLLKIPNETCDIVLCFGPMYHLQEETERKQCFNECRRIMKKDGILFVAYINKLLAMMYYTKNRMYLEKEVIEKIESGEFAQIKRFDLFIEISHFTDPNAIEKETANAGFQIISNISTDGVSYLIQDQIDEMNEQQWNDFTDMHLNHCEDKNSFGMSMHGLLICRNKKSEA